MPRPAERRLIKRLRPSWVLLDYGLQPGIGTSSVAEHLAAANFTREIVIISQNPFGQAVLGKLLPRATVVSFGSFGITRGARRVVPEPSVTL